MRNWRALGPNVADKRTETAMINQTTPTDGAAVAVPLQCQVRPLVEAETVRAPRTAAFFVLMVRYGHDYWAAHTTHRDLEAAAKQAESVNAANRQEEWRIVRVAGLPVFVAPGEVA